MAQKEFEKRTEEWLDERLDIYYQFHCSADFDYYMGALRAVEMLGYNWYTDNEGKHTIVKRK